MAIINKKMKTFNVPAGSDIKRYEIIDDAGRKMIAPDWADVSDQPFAVGEYVVKDGVVYKFTSPHAAGSAWDAGQVTATTIAAQLAAINQDIPGKADKVQNATNGHLAGLDGNGNLTDSGVTLDDTAGDGDSTKLWSADKIHGEFSNIKQALNGIGLGIENGVLVIDPVTE